MDAYTVKATATAAGINPHTLRVWERRYQLVVPKRTENGRRVYTRSDVEKLRLVKSLIDAGHGISQLAVLSTEELRALSLSTAEHARPVQSSQSGAGFLESLLAATEAFKLHDINFHLARARAYYNVRDFIFLAVTPLIRRIGDLVSAEKLSIAHEHTLSAILKTHLHQISYGLVTNERVEVDSARPPGITIATQEGDFHEIGILISALLAMSHGRSVHYLGCNMPADALGYAVNALRSPVVLIGRTLPLDYDGGGIVSPQKRYVRDLDQCLRQGTEIWLGGQIDRAVVNSKARSQVAAFYTLEQLDERFALHS